MAADCILHLEHHDLQDECLRAVVDFAASSITTWDVSPWDEYRMTYESRVAGKLMHEARGES